MLSLTLFITHYALRIDIASWHIDSDFPPNAVDVVFQVDHPGAAQGGDELQIVFRIE